MRKIIAVILLLCSSLFAKDVNNGLAEGAGVSAAISLNSKSNISYATKNDKINTCENEIKAIKADESKPFLENYDQAINIAINECVIRLK